MLQPPAHREVVDRLLHRPVDEVQPYRRLVPLSDAVDPRNGLQFERRVEERLAEEDVTRVDEVEAARVRLCVKDEDLQARVLFKVLDPVRLRDGRVTDAVALEGVFQDVKEIGESEEALAISLPVEVSIGGKRTRRI